MDLTNSKVTRYIKHDIFKNKKSIRLVHEVDGKEYTSGGKPIYKGYLTGYTQEGNFNINDINIMKKSIDFVIRPYIQPPKDFIEALIISNNSKKRLTTGDVINSVNLMFEYYNENFKDKQVYKIISLIHINNFFTIFASVIDIEKVTRSTPHTYIHDKICEIKKLLNAKPTEVFDFNLIQLDSMPDDDKLTKLLGSYHIKIYKRTISDPGYDNIDEPEIYLFHGTNMLNWPNIITAGLKIFPQGTNGSMFGRGLYFAKDMCKSQNYCTAYYNWKAVGVFGVKLGKTFKASAACECPNGYDSVSAYARKGLLNYDEYVIYSTNRCSLKYMLIL